MIKTQKISLQTKGNTDILNITDKVQQSVKYSGITEGTVTVFVTHSTVGITVIEYEPGVVADFKAMFERIIPQGIRYEHDNAWGDGNGHAHVRASLLGPSLVIPFSDGNLLLGIWQQIILVDFDNRPRSRQVIFQVSGE